MLVTFESNWEKAKTLLQEIADRHAAHLSEAAAERVAGLERIGNETFGLVMADIFLPSKSGLEVIQELHRSHPEIRIVAMTAFGAQDDIDLRSYAERYGAAGFIEKLGEQRR